MSTIRFQLHSVHFKKENGFETYFPHQTIFSLIICFHLGGHLGKIEMLNDARVASLAFFTDNVCTTRINKEKNFKIKFQVLLKFAQTLPDYYFRLGMGAEVRPLYMAHGIRKKNLGWLFRLGMGPKFGSPYTFIQL